MPRLAAGVRRLERQLNKQVSKALENVMEHLAESYLDNVTEKSVEPEGTFFGCKDGRRSCKGEYPWEDTSQGAFSISSGVDIKRGFYEGRAGLIGADHGVHIPQPGRPPTRPPGGMHLAVLSDDISRVQEASTARVMPQAAGESVQGSGRKWERLGLVDTYVEEEDRMREIFMKEFE